MRPKKKILFICYGNACRSAMAEKIVNHIYPKTAEADSAGTHSALPNISMDGPTIQVMQEVGVDIASHQPKSIGAVENTFDIVINMSPTPTEVLQSTHRNVTATQWLWWDVPDPRGQSLDVYLGVRNLLQQKIEELLA